jgi:hypothetical protein
LPHPIQIPSTTVLAVAQPQQHKESEQEMEAMAVFTGSNIFATSSSLLSTTNSNTTRITSQLRTTATHLSAFPSKSHLFSSSSTSSYAKTIRTRCSNESGIFLPRLIASLVCSLFLLTNFLNLSSTCIILNVFFFKCAGTS